MDLREKLIELMLSYQDEHDSIVLFGQTGRMA